MGFAGGVRSLFDMKYGVRIHWGLYSVAGLAHESWPFLELNYAERAHYNEIYKGWNPAGFDADAWTSLFADNGMRMFAFTTKHHEGFSLFDTRTRVKQRIRWDAAGGPALEIATCLFHHGDPLPQGYFEGALRGGHKRGCVSLCIFPTLIGTTRISVLMPIIRRKFLLPRFSTRNGWTPASAWGS